MNTNICPELTGQAVLGQKVPDFSFDTFNPSGNGFEAHSLNEYLFNGKWVVLFFYPGDFTFVCPTELADLAQHHKKLTDLGVELVSFSTDSKFAHLTWRNSEKLLEKVSYQMGSDNTGCISRYFGVYDNASGSAYRGSFIINPDGVLVGCEINSNSVGRNAEELMRKMEAFVYVRKNPAEVCPANWSQGQQTLKPSEKLVGKVHEALKGGKKVPESKKP